MKCINRDVPSDVVSFTITVLNRGKRGKDSEVAELIVDLSTLGNGQEREDWHPLAGVTPIGDWGSLRLRTRYIYIFYTILLSLIYFNLS